MHVVVKTWWGDGVITLITDVHTKHIVVYCSNQSENQVLESLCFFLLFWERVRADLWWEAALKRTLGVHSDESRVKGEVWSYFLLIVNTSCVSVALNTKLCDAFSRRQSLKTAHKYKVLFTKKVSMISSVSLALWFQSKRSELCIFSCGFIRICSDSCRMACVDVVEINYRAQVHCYAKVCLISVFLRHNEQNKLGQAYPYPCILKNIRLLPQVSKHGAFTLSGEPENTENKQQKCL